MKVSAERVLPWAIGATPIIIIIALVGFIAMSSPAHEAGGQGSAAEPQGGQTPDEPVAQTVSSTSTATPPGDGGAGGSSGLCLPLVGCA